MNLLATGTQVAAKTSSVQVNVVSLAFASWEANVTAQDLNTVNFTSYDLNFGSQGLNESFDEGLHGPITCDIGFGGDYDINHNPLGQPPGLYVRDDLGALRLLPAITAADYWNFPYMRIRQSRSSGEVNGKVLFSCSGKNQGQFEWPIADN
jgi:hypothetical protein